MMLLLRLQPNQTTQVLLTVEQRQALTALAREADLIINMAGHVKADFILGNVRRRVYVDQDPVYTQLWHDEYGEDLNFKMHDIFFSVGLNIGTRYTSIPDCGITRHHLLPTVVLEYWPFQIAPSCRRFTSIASWKGFKSLCYRGEWYRSKYEEFRRFAPLPSRTYWSASKNSAAIRIAECATSVYWP